MRIEYIGMFDEVIVPELVDERGYPQPPVRKGEPVEVDDALAARLLEQPSNWQKAPLKTGRQSTDNVAG